MSYFWYTQNNIISFFRPTRWGIVTLFVFSCVAVISFYALSQWIWDCQLSCSISSFWYQVGSFISVIFLLFIWPLAYINGLLGYLLFVLWGYCIICLVITVLAGKRRKYLLVSGVGMVSSLFVVFTMFNLYSFASIVERLRVEVYESDISGSSPRVISSSYLFSAEELSNKKIMGVGRLSYYALEPIVLSVPSSIDHVSIFFFLSNTVPERARAIDAVFWELETMDGVPLANGFDGLPYGVRDFANEELRLRVKWLWPFSLERRVIVHFTNTNE